MTLPAALACGSASAALYVWDGGGPTANWSAFNISPAAGPVGATNWGGSALRPVDGDSLTFAGTKRLASTNDWLATIGNLTFAPNAGTFSFDGNPLTVTGSIVNASGSLQTFKMQVIVGASGRTWDGGTAGITFDGGLVLGNRSLALANRIAVGTLSSDFDLGDSGTAELTLKTGSTLASRASQLGVQGPARGTVTVDGSASRWTTAGRLTVGQFGTGTLNIRNGGRVDTGALSLGNQLGSRGALSVSGSGSVLDSSSFMYVGFLGSGTLDILAGGRVSAQGVIVANNEGVVGEVTVSGNGSTWALTEDLIIGAGGRGSLLVQDQGQVSSTRGIVANAGSVVVRDGGSRWTNTGNLYVGGTPQSTLDILAGGQVSSNVGYVGDADGESGTVRVQGAGSLMSHAGDLYVGRRGQGVLEILAGGRVTNTNGILGSNGAGIGTVTVSGAGSQWSSTGDIYIGDRAQGSLVIKDGGQVLGGGSAFIGAFFSGTGAVTVSGAGSLWSNAGELHVGYGGEGRLVIQNGARVSAGQAIVSRQGVLDLSGGTLSMENLQVTAGGQFNWTSGTLHYVGDARIGSDALVDRGGAYVLLPDHLLQVSGTLVIPSGKALVISGGSLKAGTTRLEGSKVLALGGIDLSASGNIAGYGNVTGAVTGGLGRTIAAEGGTLVLGDATLAGGFRYDGTLNAGSRQVVLLSADRAALGMATTIASGGNLSTVNGAYLAPGRTLVFSGEAGIQGRFTNDGSVEGPSRSATLTFLDDVDGAGGFAGNIVFRAGYSPGHSPASVDFHGGDATYDANSVLTLEIFGPTAGAQYDQILNIGHLGFNGTLKLVFGNGYMPAPGMQFTLLGFHSFSGSLAPDRVQVAGFDAAKLDLSQLSTNGTLGIAPVPEPRTWAMVLAGLCLLRLRRRRPSQPLDARVERQAIPA